MGDKVFGLLVLAGVFFLSPHAHMWMEGEKKISAADAARGRTDFVGLESV